MNTWFLRALWVSMPVTAGAAVADALHGWSSAPRTVAAILLWILWAVVLSAVLVPRPMATTIVRLGTPLAFVVAVLTTCADPPASEASVIAIAATLAACVLAVRGDFVRVCAQGAAYGDEERFPMKLPPGIAFAVLPLTILVVGTGIAAGPLLLANESWVAGTLAVAAGAPVAFVLTRLVHQLAKRWVVLVPAGIVLADPLTLADPVLFVRERVLGIGPADPNRRPPEQAVDLRLGALLGSCALLLTQPTGIGRRVRDRSVGVETDLLVFAPVQQHRLLARAGARRLPVKRD